MVVCKGSVIITGRKRNCVDCEESEREMKELERGVNLIKKG